MHHFITFSLFAFSVVLLSTITPNYLFSPLPFLSPFSLLTASPPLYSGFRSELYALANTHTRPLIQCYGFLEPKARCGELPLLLVSDIFQLDTDAANTLDAVRGRQSTFKPNTLPQLHCILLLVWLMVRVCWLRSVQSHPNHYL